MTGKYQFNLRDLSGKTALVLGGTSGIGEGTALALARQGASVFITGFTASKGEKVVEKMKSLSPPSVNATFSYSVFDIADFNAVKEFAAKFLATNSQLHYFVMSAGGPAPPDVEQIVANGKVSRMLAVNVISRYPLLSMLAPLLESTAKSSPPGSVRIMFIANPTIAPSSLEKYKDDLGLIKIPPQSITYYMNIVVAMLYQNILMEEFSKRFPEIVFIHMHPGPVATPMVEKFPWMIRWTIGTLITISGISIEASGERMSYYLTDFDASKRNIFYVGQHDETFVPKRTGNVEEENQFLMKWLDEVCG